MRLQVVAGLWAAVRLQDPDGSLPLAPPQEKVAYLELSGSTHSCELSLDKSKRWDIAAE